MNPIKAAAIIALIVTLVAVGFMCVTLYQEKVELKFALEAARCLSCISGKEAAVANWRAVQSHLGLLDAEAKYGEEKEYLLKHAGEEPVNIDVPCDLPGPDYTTPGAVAIVGLMVSLTLFGFARRRVA
jgi:hypothetical protein